MSPGDVVYRGGQLTVGGLRDREAVKHLGKHSRGLSIGLTLDASAGRLGSVAVDSGEPPAQRLTIKLWMLDR